MSASTSLLTEAQRLYDELSLDDLPAALRRNSLDYYYLSIYPSLSEMRPIAEIGPPTYPAVVRNAYIHIPFCSGVCDFCSYYLVAISPKRRAAVVRYLEHVKAEFDYHARHSTLAIDYLYFGGGTPSLMPPEALDDLLAFLRDRCYLSRPVMGTLELHPEFFRDETAAVDFLSVLKKYGIARVSVGYQASDDDLLRDTRRRHTSGFMARAMQVLRAAGFMVNIDLMYGLPDQSPESWEATLRDAVGFVPDSIATYFLFVDRGTVMYDRVRRGEVVLPSHRQIQTQHLMAQLFLERSGYHELPNDFWARDVVEPQTFRQERLPSSAVTLPIGPGAYGYFGDMQLCNVFDLDAYGQRMTQGSSPLWRGYRLNAEQRFCRDIMFSLKNDPFLDCGLFESVYNRNPLDVFSDVFGHLVRLELVDVASGRIALTRKGRLCVEEISSLFRHSGIRAQGNLQPELEKHNFAPTYPQVIW